MPSYSLIGTICAYKHITSKGKTATQNQKLLDIKDKMRMIVAIDG